MRKSTARPSSTDIIVEINTLDWQRRSSQAPEARSREGKTARGFIADCIAAQIAALRGTAVSGLGLAAQAAVREAKEWKRGLRRVRPSAAWQKMYRVVSNFEIDREAVTLEALASSVTDKREARLLRVQIRVLRERIDVDSVHVFRGVSNEFAMEAAAWWEYDGSIPPSDFWRGRLSGRGRFARKVLFALPLAA